MSKPEDNLVPLITTENDLQESLILGELDEAGIEYVVQNFHDSAYDGLWEATLGHSKIFVFDEDLTKAKEILAQMEQ